MRNQEEFILKIVEALDVAHIPYMVSGSFSSSFHGQPRATNDVDIVINPTKNQLLSFVKSLGEGFYVSTDAALGAFENKLMFNIIDTKAGWKADLIIRKSRAYSIQEFSRRANTSALGTNLLMLSPEDSILSKLEWSKDRESEVQLNDALGVLMVQWDRLDFEYLRKWAKELHVDKQLANLIEEVKKLK